jgi:anti-sigma factor RsiW
MSDQWTDRLSEYLDGEMKGSERAFLESHLERCEDCQETLAGLRRVMMRARSLEDRPPATDLWAGVAQRIGAPTRTVVLPAVRRFTFSPGSRSRFSPRAARGCCTPARRPSRWSSRHPALRAT